MQHPILQIIKTKLQSNKNLTYIDLSHVKCSVLPDQLKNLLEKCHNLYHINLTGCGLQSLDNLPQIQVTVLEIGSNNITDNEILKLFMYKDCLEQLSLQSNHLQNIDNLSIFRKFSQLQELNLKQNPLCQINKNYNEILFNQILLNHSSLRLIDYFRKNGEILSDEEGKDNQLDGPSLMIEDQMQQEQSEVTFEQQKNTQISTLIEYLNNNERFIDPYQNCLDDEIQEQFNDEEFQEQIENKNFRSISSKKIKIQNQLNKVPDSDDFDY